MSIGCGPAAKNKQSARATPLTSPVPHPDRSDKSRPASVQESVSTSEPLIQLLDIFFIFPSFSVLAAHVINREAAGVRSWHVTPVRVLRPSAVVIHLLRSSVARLTWIRGQRGDLRGTCLVITSVFGCSEVSDRHSAAGGQNLAVFCLLLIEIWLDLCLSFVRILSYDAIIHDSAAVGACNQRSEAGGRRGHVRLLQYWCSVLPALTSDGRRVQVCYIS